MQALNKKLVRDLRRMRGQVIALSMVIASGVGVLVLAFSVLEALQTTADAYYERYNFGEVFARARRAPETLTARIAAIPGVQTVETRIKRLAILDVTGFEEPVIGELVSMPERGMPKLNQLVLRQGRFVQPGHPDEVVLNEPFAEAHELVPGSQLTALLNGKKRTLDVVGIALSPEFIYPIGPGALMPDDERYGVLWLGRDALEAAYDLDGAFDDISLTLLRGVSPEPVIERLDRLLEPYGGVGAIARKDQLSNWFLMNEIKQIEMLGQVMPAIFLAVAAFLANMVLARLIATERTEIGLLKALGYSDIKIMAYYTRMVVAMTSAGILLGWLVGGVLGRVTTELYADLYRFPLLIYQPRAGVLVIGAAVSLLAALAGTLGAVRKAATLPPAVAMRRPEPPVFRKSFVADGKLTGWLDQPTRIAVRHIARTPGRSLLTSVAVALSVGVVIMALQWLDSIDHLVQVHFVDGQRQDLMVGLVEPQASRAIEDFRHMPAVLAVEGTRIVGADLRAGARTHRGAVQGVLPDDRLQLIYDVSGRSVKVPPDGLVLATVLAEKLGVSVGDTVTIEVLEGRRPHLSVPVAALYETYIGMPAYMHLDALNRALLERPTLEYVNLLIDDAQAKDLYRELKGLPAVSSVMVKQAAIETFYKTMAQTMVIFVSFFALFAFALGFGVIYNTARISLSERARDLATLRVLGLTRLETAYILLAEIGFLVVVALPVGCLFGQLLAWYMTSQMGTELFRIPFVIEPSTYGLAICVALFSTAVSAAFVRRSLDELDLIAVLKTRE
jgi:putative ABC transport system permease protein